LQGQAASVPFAHVITVLTALSVGCAGTLAVIAGGVHGLVGLIPALLNAVFPEAAASNLALARCSAGAVANGVCMSLGTST
jgi:hypothetical protein